MRTLKYEEAFQKLIGEAEPFGVDLAVQDPVSFLAKSMNVRRNRALVLLKDLTIRGVISLVHQGIGDAIIRVVIKKREMPRRFHEVSDERRLINALWRFRRQSQQDPSLSIVHFLSFDDVRALADISQTRFYLMLGKFEKCGWIQHYQASNHKIIFISILEKFPAL